MMRHTINSCKAPWLLLVCVLTLRCGAHAASSPLEQQLSACISKNFNATPQAFEAFQNGIPSS